MSGMFEQFTAACTEQQLQLHPLVLEGRTPDDFPDAHVPYRCFVPDHLTAAIATAGRILRKNPDACLADKLVELETEHVGLAALRDIVNASTVDRQDRPDGITSGDVKALGACPDIELFFGHTLSHAAGLAKRASKLSGYDLIMDGHGSPLLLRTPHRESPSSLALRPVRINGIPYPAGSLMRVEIKHDAWGGQIQEPLKPKPSLSAPRLVSESSVVRAGFIRLTAFAYPSDERDLFFKTASGNDMYAFGTDSRRVTDLPIDVIYAAVEKNARGLPVV